MQLELYSLRHTFATVARRAGISSDARDRLLGHRPHDTKALQYAEEDLVLLAAEIEKRRRMLNPRTPPVKAPAKPAASNSQVLVRNLVPRKYTHLPAWRFPQ